MGPSRVVLALVLAAGTAFAGSKRPPDPATVDELKAAMQDGLTLQQQQQSSAAIAKLERCIELVKKLESDGADMHVKVHTEYGEKFLFELDRVCDQALREARRARAAGVDLQSEVVLAVSSTAGGAPATTLPCGPVFVTIAYKKILDPAFRLSWILDGKPGDRAPELAPLWEARSRSLLAKDARDGSHGDQLVLDPSDAKRLVQKGPFEVYRQLAALGPGQHTVKLVAQNAAAVTGETTFTLSCPAGSNPYKPAFDKARETRLATMRWTPTLPANRKWADLAWKVIGANTDQAKLLAIEASAPHVSNEPMSSIPHDRIVELRIAFQLGDTCWVAPGSMVNQYDAGARVWTDAWGPIIHDEDKDEIRCGLVEHAKR